MKHQHTKSYRITVGETQLHAVIDEEYNVSVNDNRVQVEPGKRLRSFTGTLRDGSSVPVYVEEDEDEGGFTVYLCGEAVQVQVESQRDDRLRTLRKSAAAGSAAVQIVTAPMPGLLKQVVVEAGTVVERGTALCILEAMKMENEIKSPGRFRVKRIFVESGTAVEKGARLVELVPQEEEEQATES